MRRETCPASCDVRLAAAAVLAVVHRQLSSAERLHWLSGSRIIWSARISCSVLGSWRGFNNLTMPAAPPPKTRPARRAAAARSEVLLGRARGGRRPAAVGEPPGATRQRRKHWR